MRVRIAVLSACTAITLTASAAEDQQAGGAAPAGDCVTIGTPKPGTVYQYTLTQSNGVTTQSSEQWESVTKTGSRVKTTGPSGTQIQVNEHHIVDDVAVLDRTSKQTPEGRVLESTSFKPGIVSDPAFRACAGKSWTILPVTATFQSQRITHAAQSPAGSLRILSVRERITVPAGTFDAVRYVRTSQSVDEYWKSVEQGVVVKQVSTVSGIAITRTLTSAR